MKETPTSAVSRNDGPGTPAIKLFKPVPHPFTPYTLPALELRRVLAEARAASSEPFVLEYEHLPGSVGDERWRQEALESNLTIAHK